MLRGGPGRARRGPARRPPPGRSRRAAAASDQKRGLFIGILPLGLDSARLGQDPTSWRGRRSCARPGEKTDRRPVWSARFVPAAAGDGRPLRQSCLSRGRVPVSSWSVDSGEPSDRTRRSRIRPGQHRRRQAEGGCSSSPRRTRSSSFACSSPTSSGVIKNVEVPDKQFEAALGGQHHVRRLVDRGLRPHRGVGHVPAARPLDVPRLPVDAQHRREGGARHLRHPQPGRVAVRRLPASHAEAGHRRGGAAGLRDDRGTGSRVLPVPDADGRAHDRDPRRRRLLRPDAHRPRRGRAAADRPRARGDGVRGRGRAPRGGGRASTRSTSATTTS